MTDLVSQTMRLPPEQEAIRAKCYHPAGAFSEFIKDDVEQSIRQRFEKIVQLHPNRIVVGEGNRVVTYADLNAMANSVAHRILKAQGTEMNQLPSCFNKELTRSRPCSES